MAQCIVNSHHSGHCACGQLLKGHRFEPQRSKRLSQQSLQCEPSATRQGALRLCGVSPTVFEVSAHTEQMGPQRSAHGRNTTAIYRVTWSGQLCNTIQRVAECGTLRLLSEVTVIL